MEAVIHKEHYADYTATDIDRLYHDKEALETNLKFVAENGKETLAQVFTDVRYTRKNNEFFSEEFLTALKRQGFLCGGIFLNTNYTKNTNSHKIYIVDNYNKIWVFARFPFIRSPVLPLTILHLQILSRTFSIRFSIAL
jgi:hypothetical protein